MTKYRIVLLLALVFENYACKHTSTKFGQLNGYTKQEIPATFSELVQRAYFYRDNDNFPELCRLLNDSILSCKTKTLLRTTSIIDTVNSCILWEFKPVDPEPYLEIRASDRFSFRVCITTENDILINGCKDDISAIKQQAVAYIFYPNEEGKSIIIENHDIAMIGNIEVSRAVTEMYRDVIDVSGLNVNEWKLFFDCMHELMLAFEEERNKKSLEIWGVEYHLLSCDKMEVLTKVVDYKIIIDLFNIVWYSNCSPPPPNM